MLRRQRLCSTHDARPPLAEARPFSSLARVDGARRGSGATLPDVTFRLGGDASAAAGLLQPHAEHK